MYLFLVDKILGIGLIDFGDSSSIMVFKGNLHTNGNWEGFLHINL